MKKHIHPTLTADGIGDYAEAVDRLLAFHKAHFGNTRMEDDPTSPERPEGVSEQEWDALGDPGKAALVRERAARTDAEQKLASAAKPKPVPPKQQQQPPAEQKPKGGDGDGQDISALIQQAVDQALAPFQARQDQWEADQAAGKVRDAVLTAAGARLHDASDAISNLNLAELTDGNGAADSAKISRALDDLVATKPHLAKPIDGRRTPPPGAPFGGTGGSTIPLDDRVKNTLARMQASQGIRPKADA